MTTPKLPEPPPPTYATGVKIPSWALVLIIGLITGFLGFYGGYQKAEGEADATNKFVHERFAERIKALEDYKTATELEKKTELEDLRKSKQQYTSEMENLLKLYRSNAPRP